jgi:hypothetical protein
LPEREASQKKKTSIMYGCKNASRHLYIVWEGVSSQTPNRPKNGLQKQPGDGSCAVPQLLRHIQEAIGLKENSARAWLEGKIPMSQISTDYGGKGVIGVGWSVLKFIVFFPDFDLIYWTWSTPYQ